MWSVIGHEGAVRFLGQSLAQAALAHAYLLVGPPHVGKGTLALDLAQAVNCLQLPPTEEALSPCGGCAQCRRIASGLHADVVTLGVSGEEGRKNIGIDQVRELQRLAHLKPYEGRCRVFIVDGAEHLSEEASNSLLKTLEEPPPDVLLLLLTAREEALLPTVRSRCTRLRLHPLPAAQVASALQTRFGLAAELAQELARLSQGAVGWAIQAARDRQVLEARARQIERLASLAGEGLEERFSYAAELAALFPRNRQGVLETLELWVSWWRDLFLLGAGAPEVVVNQGHRPLLQEQAQRFSPQEASQAVRSIMRTAELLELNVNPRLALEGLMLALPHRAGRVSVG